MEKVYKTSKVKFITDIAIGAEAGRRSFGTRDFETEIPTLSSTFSQIFTKKSCNWLGYIYISEKVNYFFFVFLPYNQKQRWEERMNLRKKTL